MSKATPENYAEMIQYYENNGIPHWEEEFLNDYIHNTIMRPLEPIERTKFNFSRVWYNDINDNNILKNDNLLSIESIRRTKFNFSRIWYVNNGLLNNKLISIAEIHRMIFNPYLDWTIVNKNETEKILFNKNLMDLAGEFPDIANITHPMPIWIWKLYDSNNDGTIDRLDIIYKQDIVKVELPFPFNVWRQENDYRDFPDNELKTGIDYPEILGAFGNSNIKETILKEITKKLGDQTFRYSDLEKIIMSRNVEFTRDTFPKLHDVEIQYID